MVNICMWGLEMLKISKLFPASKPKKEISFLDVKELHNLAHEQKIQVRKTLRRYRLTVAKAQAMDAAYRTQLGLRRRYMRQHSRCACRYATPTQSER